MSQASVIAIVDDDPDVRGSVSSLVRSAGLVGLQFASAAELLRCSAPERIDCIITDLQMPEMTGVELQAELNHRGWKHPLLVMTAFATEAVRDQMLACGARAFLTKPLDPDALLDAIEDVLR